MIYSFWQRQSWINLLMWSKVKRLKCFSRWSSERVAVNKAADWSVSPLLVWRHGNSSGLTSTKDEGENPWLLNGDRRPYIYLLCIKIEYWTTSDHSLKVEDIRSYSVYFFVCLFVCLCVGSRSVFNSYYHTNWRSTFRVTIWYLATWSKLNTFSRTFNFCLMDTVTFFF